MLAGNSPKKENIYSYLGHIGNALDKLIGKYDNLIIIGDFNSQMEEDAMNDFCDIYNLKNLIKEPTCFTNAQHPTTIGLILTNKSESFQNSICIETGLSDHHKMIITVLKVHFKKLNPIKIKYRNYKNFNLYYFKEKLKTSLLSMDQGNIKYDKFKEVFMNVLNEYAPMKEKTCTRE